MYMYMTVYACVNIHVCVCDDLPICLLAYLLGETVVCGCHSTVHLEEKSSGHVSQTTLHAIINSSL